MNIVIDCSVLMHKEIRGRGIGRYSETILKGILERIDKQDKVFCVVYSQSDALLFKSYYPEIEVYTIVLGEDTRNFNEYDDDVFYKYGVKSFKFFFEAYDIDIYVSMWHLGIPFNFLKPLKGKIKTKFIVVVHDLIQHVFSDYYMQDEKSKKSLNDKLDIAKYADKIISISNATKRDIIKYGKISGDIIKTIYEGGDIFNTSSHEIAFRFVTAKFGINRKYIMYTGGDDYRKNIEGLIEAYSLLDKGIKEKYQLLIVCKIYKQKYYNKIVKKMSLEDKIIFTNFVSDEELNSLYKNADLFVFPSLYEGFGLPVLEAMEYGIPVIAGNNSSMPELIGEKGIYFEASNSKDIANKIKYVLQNDNIRKELIENSKNRVKLFSWEKCKQEFFDTIKNESINISKTEIEDDKKLKVAFFSPLNPEASGISDYSEELIPELMKYVNMDIYTKNINITNEFIKNNLKLYKYEDIENNYTDYDIIIYQMGNSDFHKEIMEYARKYSGIVVLHDYNMRTFLTYYSEKYIDENSREEFKKKVIQEQYGDELGINLYNEHRDNLWDAKEIELNRHVIANSLSVIVHSDYVKRNVLYYSGNIPMFKVEQGMKNLSEQYTMDDKIAVLNKYGIKNQSFVIGFFGEISKERRDVAVLEAFGRYLKKNKTAHLIFAGSPSDEFLNNVEQIDKKYSIKKNIHILERVCMDDFLKLMYACDYAVNLRKHPTNGETSGSLLRLFSIGKPVVVSDTGTFSEYPDDVCIKITKDIEKDADELYEVMIKLEDENIRRSYSEKAIQYIRDNCLINKVASDYYSVIRKTNELKKTFYKDLDSKYMEIILKHFFKVNNGQINFNEIADSLYRIGGM